MRYKKINWLYEKNPALYDALSSDRDFDKEAKFLIENSPSHICSTLELMAGPARHSKYLNQLGHSGEALDISDGMYRYSQEFVASLPYTVGDCIEVLSHSERVYDLIFLLRFGIGYIAFEDLFDFFKGISRSLSDRGVFFVEVHRLNSILFNVDSLNIRSRRFVYDDRAYECIWPFGKVRVSEEKLLGSFVVRIYDSENDTEFLYSSEEYIHSVDILINVAKLYGLRGFLLESELSGLVVRFEKGEV